MDLRQQPCAVVVMFVGIGLGSLVIGAVAQQFIAPNITSSADELEHAEEDLLAQVRDIAARLDHLQAAIERQPQRSTVPRSPR